MKLSYSACRYSAYFVVVMLICLPAIALANDGVPPRSSSSSVKSTPRVAILEISDRIDDFVQTKLELNQEQLNPPASDEVFLRRIYLDIGGRIPTIDETRRFLDSTDASKRADLIDELLDSYAHVSRQFNFWADLLRVKSRMRGNQTGIPYIDFIKDSLEANKPYDQFVRELVSSKGPSLERGNGAVGYYLRDRNMPEDNMSNTIRVFLGTRLECAQCHDHPFDEWTQRQYFEMVAFTGGMRYQIPQTSTVSRELRSLVRKEGFSQTQRQMVNRLTRSLSQGIAGQGTGLARLPEGFMGDDGHEGEIVTAKTMFEAAPLVDAKIPAKPKRKRKKQRVKKNVQQAAIPGARDLDSRTAYAQWMTDAENPRFAKVIANRLWKQAFGLGLIEPVDILEDGSRASNPDLMDYLTETIVEIDFDMKQFLRAIYNSKTYQASAYDRDIPDPLEYGFNGPTVRRMSAEQIWDSLLVLTVPTIDERSQGGRAGRYALPTRDPYENFERLKEMDAEQILQLVSEMGNQRASDRRKKFRDQPAFKKMQAERNRIGKQIRNARRKKDVMLEKELLLKQAKMTSEFRKRRQTADYSRASEMQSPAPAGHFLREFGQSDREVIDNSELEPAVTQVLSMMNGYVDTRIARDGNSVLMQSALQAEGAKERVEAIFLSMLNRMPSTREAQVWEKDFEAASKNNNRAGSKEVYSDLIWTLANSNEFIFVK